MRLHKRVDTRPLPPLPYTLSTTGTYDGDDGRWSTFWINIGDSDASGGGQNFKVLPSTSSSNTLIPLQAEWCDADCAKLRGVGTVSGQQVRGAQQSKVWQEKGIFQIPTPWGWSGANVTDTWNSTPNGLLGTDYVGLGESSPQSPILTDQYIFKYTIKDFFMGSLGLAIGQFGPQGASRPNFLDNFYASKIPYIASRSYAYTAGAYYRNNNNGIAGSLIFGGYDKSRMAGPGVSIRMPGDRNNTLAVGVQSITWRPDQNKEANQLSLTINSGSFSAIIDSTLPYLILPDAVCDEFATRFQLDFDEERRVYTVNTSAHNWNIGQDATVIFLIVPGPQDSAKFASIALPYAAFDHNLSFPIEDQSIRYFPIKRSENGVYVLGRTFLQEAYLVVDYERTNFTVAPAYSSDDVAPPNLIPIFNNTYVVNETGQSHGNGGLSAGAIAGIVVGIVLAFIIAGVGAFLFWKRRRDAENKALQDSNPSEIDTTFAGTEVKYRRVSELTGSEAPRSPKYSTAGYYGDPKSIPPISEMSPESTPAELYSPPPDGERETYDYFAAGRVGRRGATRDRDSSGHNSPRTLIAELPGEDVRPSAAQQHPGSKHGRGQSDASLSTNIAEVLAGKEMKEPLEPHPEVRSGAPATSEEIVLSTADVQVHGTEHEAKSAPERRPSHARGLSDTTMQSDSTAVSQPTPEELERWARSVDDGSQRPMSP